MSRSASPCLVSDRSLHYPDAAYASSLMKGWAGLAMFVVYWTCLTTAVASSLSSTILVLSAGLQATHWDQRSFMTALKVRASSPANRGKRPRPDISRRRSEEGRVE